MKKIVVIGGGIGGLTFAVAARRAGFEVAVLEREANVVRTGLGGGLGLWPPSQQVLEQIDALAALRERGRFMSRPAYCNRHGRILAEPSQNFPTRFPILCVERSALLDVLMARCASEGVEVLANATCERLSAFDETLRVDVHVTSKGGPIAADLVIGGDGIHSRVRSTLLSDTTRSSPQHCGYTYFRSSIPAATRAPEKAWHAKTFECWSDGIRFGYVPLQEPSVFWFAAVPIGHRGLEARRSAHVLSERERAWLIDLLQGWRGPQTGAQPEERLDVGALLRLTRAEEILRTDIYKIRDVTRFPWSNAAGNVVLLGDACHATAPNLAQGAGLSIEDAAELAVQLSCAAKAAAMPGVRDDARHALWRRELRAAVDRYEAARKPRARTVQTLADSIATVGQLRPPLSGLRDAAMGLPARLLPGTTARIFEAVVTRSLGGGRRRMTWEHPGVCLPVVEAVLGREAFERCIPKPAQDFRRLTAGGRGSGSVTVEIGSGWLARLIATAASLPPAMSDAPFEASAIPIDGDRERWTRRFGTIAFATTMSRVRHLGRSGGATGLLLTEGIGGAFDRLVRFGYRVTDATRNGAADHPTPVRAVTFESAGIWIADRVKLPLPAWLQPTSAWIEEEIISMPAADGHRPGWRFDGRIELPAVLGGQLLMAYRGEFAPNPSCFPERYGSADASPTQHAIVFGGTGFLGRKVCAELLERGWQVTVPSRRPRPAPRACFDTPRYSEVAWHPDAKDAAAAALRDVLARSSTLPRVVVINLAGENPGSKRWSSRTMQTIMESRLAAITVVEKLLGLLREDIASARLPAAAFPAAMLQASAVGIYGHQGAQPQSDVDSGHIDADDPALPRAGTPDRITEPAAIRRGRAFRIACCRDLETAAARLADPPAASGQTLPHVANLRIGMVLGQGDGLLPHLQRATALGASRFGSGQQRVSWIHIGDAARVIAELAGHTGRFADDDSPVFAVNVCSPNPVSCSELLTAVRTAQRASRRLSILAPPNCVPIPKAALALAIGPSAAAVLDGQNAAPVRLQARLGTADFSRLFLFPKVEEALNSWECAVSSRP